MDAKDNTKVMEEVPLVAKHEDVKDARRKNTLQKQRTYILHTTSSVELFARLFQSLE